MMGVLRCSRTGCDSFMCGVLAERSFHVCVDCSREFREIVGDTPIPYKEMLARFMEFMATEKPLSVRVDMVDVGQFLMGDATA